LKGEGMSIAEMLLKYRKNTGISQQKLAQKLSIPVEIIEFIENPSHKQDTIINYFTSVLGISPEEFRGNKPLKTEKPKPQDRPEQSEVAKSSHDELKENVLKNAKFPKIREFLIRTSQCSSQEKLLELFVNSDLSSAEKLVIHFMSTAALLHFCNTNSSSFSFDKYLFNLHTKLLANFEKELDKKQLSPEEREARLTSAKSNIFCCDTIDNIAVYIIGHFAKEMEEKLSKGSDDFIEELEMPFLWNIDDSFKNIEVLDKDGNMKKQIKLQEATSS
jgi:transcriptional regulator with XRE-family HTH domain